MVQKDILIQHEFNFLGNDRTIISERKRKRLTLTDQLLNL
jgi:hypothetical protein